MVVEIDAIVVEQGLGRGARHRACEVVEGLPETARLVSAAFDPLRRMLTLGFTVPGEDDPTRRRLIAIRTEA